MQYFDKSFFKFLLGFTAIIMLSLIAVILLRVYQAPQKYVAEVLSSFIK